MTDLAFERDLNHEKIGAEEAVFRGVHKQAPLKKDAFNAKPKLTAGHKYIAGISASALMHKTSGNLG